MVHCFLKLSRLDEKCDVVGSSVMDSELEGQDLHPKADTMWSGRPRAAIYSPCGHRIELGDFVWAHGGPHINAQFRHCPTGYDSLTPKGRSQESPLHVT